MNKLLLIRKSIESLLTPLILLSLAGSAMAQENRVASGRSMPTPPAQAQGPSDPAERLALPAALHLR